MRKSCCDRAVCVVLNSTDYGWGLDSNTVEMTTAKHDLTTFTEVQSLSFL